MTKTITLPISDLTQSGGKMFNWLGSLWTSIFQDSKLIKNWTDAHGFLSTQLYLNFLETLNLPDRKNSPVFHRERWQMVTLRLADRNKAKGIQIQLGEAVVPVIGPQTDPAFVVGSILTVGGPKTLRGVTAYPLAAIKDIATALVDDIVNPTKFLVNGVDFRIEDDSLVFYNFNDPFDLGFPTRTVQEDGVEHTEVALWAADALIDREHVYNYLGHVLGIRDASSEFYSRYLNALWDVYNSGASLALFRAGIAAMLDEPYILDTTETVEVITETPRRQVITDKHVYDITTTAALRDEVAVDAVLTFGQVLTDSIRIWDNLDPTRLSAGGQDADQLRLDVPALFLPSGFFRSRLSHGLGLTWDLEPITYAGADANSNAKLRFTIHGSTEDIDMFWQDFWDYCETQGIDGKTCFSGYLHDTLPKIEGVEWGRVSPIEYFLHNFLKANLIIVAVDSNKLSAQGRQMLFLLTTFNQAIPAHTCFFITDRQDVGPEVYDLAQTEDGATPLLAVSRSETAGTGVSTKTNLWYGDTHPRVTWVPTCRRQTDEANT